MATIAHLMAAKLKLKLLETIIAHFILVRCRQKQLYLQGRIEKGVARFDGQAFERRFDEQVAYLFLYIY
jgi:hypothetical protein